MRAIFWAIALAAVAYGLLRVVPAETRERALGAIGLSGFFRETLPSYLRQKLTIPSDPAAIRRRLVGELAEKIAAVEGELDAAVPAATDGAVPSVASEAVVRKSIEHARKFLGESEDVLRGLEGANAGESPFREAARRLLDKILPPVDTGGGSRCQCAPE